MLNIYQESDTVEYEDGLDCDTFDNADFWWENTTHIGAKGLLEYLEDDLIQLIYHDMHDQENNFASQPILLEGTPAYHTTTRLKTQMYTDEIYDNERDDIDTDDCQAR
ncbi:hypothetical protein CaCOL14_012647 [Colletotrichum acutatum]